MKMKKSRRFGKKKRAKAFKLRKRNDVIDSSFEIPSDLDDSSEVPSDFYDSDLESSFGDDHFGRFLQYQVERMILHKPPDNNFVHFCLASYHLLGPKAYAVRGKAFKWIPVDILMRIFEDINFRAGVNHKLNQLIHLKFELAKESDKLCTLSIDEMMLKRQLHYDEKEDMIIGFEDSGTERTPRIARFVTFFSLRGLFGDWKMPVAYFFTPEPSTPEGLKTKLLSVLNSLENYKIKVCAVIGKMRANIYDLSQLLGISPINQRFNTDSKSPFFLFDTPQLMNSTRNNLMKYEVRFNNHRASWKHVVNFHKQMMKKENITGWIIGEVHVNPDKTQITDCSLAIDLLNEDVAEKMQNYIDEGILPKGAQGTVKFISFFAKLFNFMNSSKIKSFNEYCEAFSGSKKQIDFLNESYRFLEHFRIFRGSQNITNEVKFISGWKNNILALMKLAMVIQENLVMADQLPRYILLTRLSSGPCCVWNRFRGVLNPTAIDFVTNFKFSFMHNYMKHTLTEKLDEFEFYERIYEKIPKNGSHNNSEENDNSDRAYLRAQVH